MMMKKILRLVFVVRCFLGNEALRTPLGVVGSKRRMVVCRMTDKTLESSWKGRRIIARKVFDAKVAFDEEERQLKEEEENDEDKDAREESAKSAVASTAFGVAIVALILRFGGRAALLNVLGLNAEADEELSKQVADIVAWKESLPPAVFFGGYTLLWTAAKTLCFDGLSLGLALASGVLFGGVVEGAVVSSACAALGGSVPFLVARNSDLRPKILTLARRNPRARALEKSVADKGFSTVLALRLAPILPVPLGAYNYLYGATTMQYFPFALATFLGSLCVRRLSGPLGARYGRCRGSGARQGQWLGRSEVAFDFWSLYRRRRVSVRGRDLSLARD